ncbi:MAG: hypothetical protein ACI8PZ_002341 [Myxococcota bacterium]|jgi:hypothetical protein
MNVSELTYDRIAKGIGVMLTGMGASLLLLFCVFAATAINPIDAALPGLGGVGLMLFASVGAFALPVGGALVRGGPDAQGHLRVAAMALGLMAVVRLVAFSNLEIRTIIEHLQAGDAFDSAAYDPLRYV